VRELQDVRILETISDEFEEMEALDCGILNYACFIVVIYIHFLHSQIKTIVPPASFHAISLACASTNASWVATWVRVKGNPSSDLFL
jgi:hypothetical protein